MFESETWCLTAYVVHVQGNPKGVASSHRNTYMHALALMASDFQSIRGYECACPVVLMFHNRR